MNKVILVDDHKMLRKGVTTYLLENSDWTVIGEAESLAELEPLLKQLTFFQTLADEDALQTYFP